MDKKLWCSCDSYGKLLAHNILVCHAITEVCDEQPC